MAGILTEQVSYQGARNYWKVLKYRLLKEGNETVTDCNQLKMQVTDGKMRQTDVADTEQLLRLIQSIPSKKAEPFKLWLAAVSSERLDEADDPELTFDRAMQTYLAKGYSREWINQRLKSIEVRKELTDPWQERGTKQGVASVPTPTIQQTPHRTPPTSLVLVATLHYTGRISPSPTAVSHPTGVS